MERVWNLCRKHTLQKPRVAVLSEDTFLEQWIIPKGTEIKAFETKNFGFIILPKGTQDKRGFEIPRRIFKH